LQIHISFFGGVWTNSLPFLFAPHKHYTGGTIGPEPA